MLVGPAGDRAVDPFTLAHQLTGGFGNLHCGSVGLGLRQGLPAHEQALWQLKGQADACSQNVGAQLPCVGSPFPLAGCQIDTVPCMAPSSSGRELG